MNVLKVLYVDTDTVGFVTHSVVFIKARFPG